MWPDFDFHGQIFANVFFLKNFIDDQDNAAEISQYIEVAARYYAIFKF